jgi:hypothetical protein
VSLKSDFKLYLPYLPLGLVILFLFFFTHNDLFAGLHSDEAIYLLLADYYSPWLDKNNDLLFTFVLSQSWFPPGYPLLLALLGGGSDTIPIAHFINTTFLAVSLICYASWLRRSGHELASLLFPSLFALSPYVLIFSLGIFSEFVFLAILLAVLYLHENGSRSKKTLLTISLLVATAPLIRTAAIALLLAWLINLLRSNHPYRIRYILITVLPFLLWSFWKQFNGIGHNYIRLVIDGVKHQDLSYLLDTPLYVASRIAPGWNEYFGTATGPWYWVILFLLILATVGMVLRLYEGKLDAIFTLLYFLIVLFWPYPQFITRFLLPVIPLLIFYSYLATSELMRFMFGNTGSKSSWIVALILGVSIYIPTGSILIRYCQLVSLYGNNSVTQDFYREPDLQNAIEENEIRKKIISGLAHLNKHMDNNACIHSTATALTMFYTRRVSVVMPDSFSSPDLLCDYILTIPWDSGGYVAFHGIDKLVANDNFQPTHIEEHQQKVFFALFEKVTDPTD